MAVGFICIVSLGDDIFCVDLPPFLDICFGAMFCDCLQVRVTRLCFGPLILRCRCTPRHPFRAGLSVRLSSRNVARRESFVSAPPLSVGHIDRL